MIENVTVEMTDRSYELTGRVVDEHRRLVRDCVVIVFAQDPDRWSVETRYLGIGRPERDDRYHVRLLPGDYYAVAMAEVEANAWTDRDFLTLARDRATKITVGAAPSAIMLDLTLSPTPVL